MKEIWKDIPEYEGLYQVSNLGRIKSLRRNKLMSLNTGSIEYYQVKLTKNKVIRSYLLHRLVAITFIPNPSNLKEINHKDSNKLNNYIDNLEWVTSKQNTKHSYDSGRKKPMRGELGPLAKINNAQVVEIRRLIKEGNLTQTKIGQMFGLKPSAISSIKKRQTWKDI